MAQKTCSVSVLGGDGRQRVMINELATNGFEVCAWGIDGLTAAAHVCVSADWREAVANSRAVILPLPCSTDGVHLNATAGDALRLDVLLREMNGGVLLGGRLSESTRNLAEKYGIRCIDYYESEVLQLKNALPSAEGGIFEAMRHLPVTVKGCEAAVIGYGRIGELLAKMLCALGADVTVYARREESLTRARLADCRVVKILQINGNSVIKDVSASVRVIFNTVPERLLGKELLQTLASNCLLIDLASAPGGIDFETARSLGLKAVWATGLPGKYAPESAGIYLAETVGDILRNDI